MYVDGNTIASQVNELEQQITQLEDAHREKTMWYKNNCDNLSWEEKNENCAFVLGQMAGINDEINNLEGDLRNERELVSKEQRQATHQYNVILIVALCTLMIGTIFIFLIYFLFIKSRDK